MSNKNKEIQGTAMNTGNKPHLVGNEFLSTELEIDNETVTTANDSIDRNVLGEIASSYQKLHNISKLCEAREYAKLTQGSYNSSIQSVFLAAEIALLNLTRLTNKASCKLAQHDLEGAYVYIRWIRGFHKIMRTIGSAAIELQQNNFIEPSATNEYTNVSIIQSPALAHYIEAHKKHEVLFEDLLLNKKLDELKISMGQKSHDDIHYALIHNMRLNAHDSVKWESDLSDIIVDQDMPAYSDMIAQEIISDAVKSATLEQESYYPEFVALHQIPEILCAQVNDHTELAILALRSGKLSEVQEQLTIGNALMPAFIKSQSVMADCLATAEYHYLRENLGPASGIHSLNIRQHMFRDLFSCLWKEFETWLAQDKQTIERSVTNITKHRHETHDNWLKHQVINSLMSLHKAHQEWRHEHLHMPRNCLGSGGTKSMIGAPDGLEVVRKMRDASNALPTLKALYKHRNIKLPNQQHSAPLNELHSDHNSLDNKIILLTGQITRDFFPEVQKKEFCPFRSNHPVRKP